MVDSTETDSEIISPLKPHYVYVLIDPSVTDPLINGIFYVGKGQEERAFEHRKDSLKTEGNSEKLERFRAIEKSGKFKVKEMVIGRFDSADEAFAVEATLIHWMYGYENLTNVARGHGADTIRNKGCASDLEGIDIPVKVRTNNGEYSEGFIQARGKFDVVQSVEKIKKFLEMNSNLRFGEVDTSNARWTTISLEIKGLMLVVGKHNSSDDKFWIEIRPASNNKVGRDQLRKFCDNSEFVARNDGGYAKLREYEKMLTDPEEVLAVTLKYLDELLGSST